MNTNIKNMSDLDQAIMHLKSLERIQAESVKKRFSDPRQIFALVAKLSSKSGISNVELTEKFLFQPLIGILTRLALPVLLNKTLLKNSNIFVKGLILLLSQKISGLTKVMLTAVLEPLTSFFNKAKNGPINPRTTSG